MRHAALLPMPFRRRAVGVLSGGLVAAALARPAGASAEALAAAVRAFAGEAPIAKGRVRLDIPPLVENGNAVPLTVGVDSPMTPDDHVRRIAVFNERNPQPNVITARIGPRAGRAGLSTRIRLATSQRLVAVAEMSDGSFWSDSAEVVVTLAACVEG
jgi:sulfur-oxidizing protein SoxY